MAPSQHLRFAAVLLLSAEIVGCLRGPIRDFSDDDLVAASSSGGEDDTTDGTTLEPTPQCHSSYDPCLPVEDDLDCADVIALGAAPVTVVGPDEYGLDRDNDGIGCEQ
ncbi:MAG: excalibur calcium-binding domain-containing protein [Myxococcota bacterium]